MENIETLHEQVIHEISEKTNEEISKFIDARKVRKEASEKQNKQIMEQMEAMGLNIKSFGSLPNAKSIESTKYAEKIKVKLPEVQQVAKKVPVELLRDRAWKAASSPIRRSIPPYHVAVFSTKDAKDKLSDGTGTDIPNYTSFDNILVAIGGGWSDAGNFWNVWDFTFPFTPSTSGLYELKFDNVFHGSRLISSKGRIPPPWLRKPAWARIDITTDVWQNGQWIGPRVTMEQYTSRIEWYDERSSRVDIEVSIPHTVSLQAGIQAILLNRVRFEVYAEGEGTRAELDFATGVKNYFQCPWVHITEPLAATCRDYCRRNPGQC